MDNTTMGLLSVLKQKNADIIRDAAAKAEKDGKPAKAQLALAHEQKWFRLLAPTTGGGLQMPLPDMLETTEAVAWADGSMGWAVANCACAGWYAAYNAVATQPTEKMLLTAAPDITGIAEKKADSYVISGYWQHLPLAEEAAGYAVQCYLREQGQPLTDANGTPQTVSFVLNKEEVTVMPIWNGMGLAASAAHDIEVKKLTVGAERAILPDTVFATEAQLYRYPQLQMKEAAVAVAICGMTQHFNDLCKLMLTVKHNQYGQPVANNGVVMDIFQKGAQRVADARSKLYYAVQMTWQACANGLTIKPAVLYKVSVGAYDLVRKCREHVDAVYPFLGMAAADKSSEINRVWRDIHTASMHSLLVFGNLPG